MLFSNHTGATRATTFLFRYHAPRATVDVYPSPLRFLLLVVSVTGWTVNMAASSYPTLLATFLAEAFSRWRAKSWRMFLLG
jgi:hypothetical protein